VRLSHRVASRGGRVYAVRSLPDDDGVAAYSFWFQVEPAGSFGVPEEGRTVVPPGEFTGPTFLTNSMARVAHGTLPLYRAPDDAVNMTLSLGSSTAHFQDNYLLIVIEGDEYDATRAEAQETADRLMKQLALGQGRSFSAELIAAEDDEGNRTPILHSVQAFALTTYDLDGMRAAIAEAGRALPLSDERLERALDYYDHALYLIARNVRTQGGVVSRHYDFTVAAIFLNLWKAVTVIIGEPDERDYQSRYRTIGLDYEFFSTKISRLKNLRDAYDVAHHHLDADRIEDVKAEYGEAANIAKEVISRYREMLHAEGPGG
jgi:hypothetical protein